MAIPGMVGGSGRPFLKYNAKGGRWSIDGKEHVSITAIFDVERAQAGWAKFTQSGPSFEMVSIETLTNGGRYPPQPTEVDAEGRPAWSRAFKVIVKLSDQLANGAATIRELSSNALATTRAFDALHDQWLAGRQIGKVPVVSCSEYEKVEGKGGHSYKPVFRIEKWIARPEDMLDEEPAPPAVGTPEDLDDKLNDSIPF